MKIKDKEQRKVQRRYLTMIIITKIKGFHLLLEHSVKLFPVY